MSGGLRLLFYDPFFENLITKKKGGREHTMYIQSW